MHEKDFDCGDSGAVDFQHADRAGSSPNTLRSSPQLLPLKLKVTMSSNVGLSTPRGSGTSGYVQRNLSYLKPRDRVAPYPEDIPKHRQRKPDPDILEHERKRKIEVKVFELRDQLEDEG